MGRNESTMTPLITIDTTVPLWRANGIGQPGGRGGRVEAHLEARRRQERVFGTRAGDTSWPLAPVSSGSGEAPKPLITRRIQS